VSLIVLDDEVLVSAPESGEVISIRRDQVERFKVTKSDKASFVHRDESVPLEQYPITRLVASRNDGAGRTTAVCFTDSLDEPLLVEYRKGLWHRLTELPFDSIGGLWLTARSGDSQTLIVVGKEGRVALYEFENGNLVEQSIADGSEASAGDLVRVWGVDRSHYWALDAEGAVWARKDSTWTNVAKPIQFEGNSRKLVDFWVSPDGTVFSITKTQIFRL
jgi:hypothetical protein